jgi:hypothetical protein
MFISTPTPKHVGVILIKIYINYLPICWYLINIYCTFVVVVVVVVVVVQDTSTGLSKKLYVIV